MGENYALFRKVKKNIRGALNVGLRPVGFEVDHYPSKRSLYLNRINTELYRKLFGDRIKENRKLLNFGAGPFKHEFWTNVDYFSETIRNRDNVDVLANFFETKPIELESDSAELIYSSHCIEHLPIENARYHLREMNRILKPGGMVRIICPDWNIYFDAYHRQDPLFVYDSLSLPRVIAHACASALNQKQHSRFVSEEEIVSILENHKAEEAAEKLVSMCDIEYHYQHPFNHISWWTRDRFETELKEAGFKTIHTSRHGQSLNPVLRDTRYFDSTGIHDSVYVEAFK